jgi:hypothetical protein
MGRPRKEPEPPSRPDRPKCYPVVVASPDEQAAFEAMAEHQHRANVETWLGDLARGYVRRYFRRHMPNTEGADA